MEENNITVDKAVQTIKGAILRAQAQASQSSNAIQLSLYYGIGRYVSINLQQAHWGAKALDSISERLQRELPGLIGFSSGNLKKMRIFYEEWQCLSIGSPLANQLKGIAIPHRRYAFSLSYQKKNLLILVIHVAACH